MVKRIGWIASSTMAAAVIAVFLFAGGLIAQSAASPQETKQLVPDNPSEHTPPVQPIPYSHKQHLSQGLQCKDCHTNPEPGKVMTFPDTSKCMLCHVAVAKDKPSIKKLAAYAKSKEAVPWVRVYTVLPGVAWNHRPHLEAGVKCETCHGKVREMEVMSEVTSVTTMYSCLHCHEMSQAKTACDTCHKP